MTEFEEWRVQMACKIIRRDEGYLGRQTTDIERAEILHAATHWTEGQINDAITAIRLNGGDVGEG
jgi:hypothetical protein